MRQKLLLIAGALVDTGGPVKTGYSKFVPEDPLPKLLPEDAGDSPARWASVWTLCFRTTFSHTLASKILYWLKKLFFWNSHRISECPLLLALCDAWGKGRKKLSATFLIDAKSGMDRFLSCIIANYLETALVKEKTSKIVVAQDFFVPCSAYNEGSRKI